jgi:hypothetical protein
MVMQGERFVKQGKEKVLASAVGLIFSITLLVTLGAKLYVVLVQIFS